MTTTWNPDGLNTICVDFNGVLDTYRGYKPGYMYPARPGADRFLAELSSKYKVVILTSADVDDVVKWLNEYNLYQYITMVTDKKVAAIAYIDDRAIRFDGSFDKVLNTLDVFKCFWEDEEHRETPMK
jgi:hypothetical protein